MEYRGNIEKITINNKFYRKVLHTTKNMQLVVILGLVQYSVMIFK